MKKITSILISMLMAVSITGCAAKNETYSSDNMADLGDDDLKETLKEIQQNNKDADVQSFADVSDSGELITQDISSGLEDAVPSFSNQEDTDTETATSNSSLRLVTYSTDDFSVTMPKGWTIVTGGQYASFEFKLFNPNDTRYQIFRFGALAPFLKSWDSKNFWQSKFGSGMIPDAPVMTDRSAGGLLDIWDDVISYQKVYNDMMFPYLDDIYIQSNTAYSGLYTQAGGSESVAVATGTTGGKDVQCVLSTAVFDPGTNYNDGIDTGYLILYETVGIFAPANASSADVQAMLKCASSIQFSDDYVKQSKQASGQALSSVSAQLAANRVLMDAMQTKWRDYING